MSNTLNPMPGMHVQISVEGVEKERLKKIEQAEVQRAAKWAGFTIDVSMIPPGSEPRAEVEQTDESIRVKLFVPEADLSRTCFAIDDEGNLLWIVEEEE